jgi:hypothetical protein
MHDGRLGVLRALREALKQHSENDSSRETETARGLLLRKLPQSRSCAEDRPKIADWMEHNEIIAAIREWQRLGKPLGYPAARRDDPALVSAAEAYFGPGATLCTLPGLIQICICEASGQKRSS